MSVKRKVTVPSGKLIGHLSSQAIRLSFCSLRQGVSPALNGTKALSSTCVDDRPLHGPTLDIDLVGLQMLERAVERPERTHYIVAQDQTQKEGNGGVVGLHPSCAHDQELYQPGDEKAEPEIFH